MQDRVLGFVGALRRSGLAISVAESLDALRAVGAVGIDREPLREALASCLVKDEHDRLLFDNLFELHFPLLGPGRRAGRGRREAGAGGGTAGRAMTHGDGATLRASAGDAAEGRTGRATERRRDPKAPARDGQSTARDRGRTSSETGAAGARAERQLLEAERPSVGWCRARRELMKKPFRDYTPSEVEESHELVRLLARELRGRLARRLRLARRGRLDVRRTLRRAAASGGVPVHLVFRGPRPGRPDLVALCDVSGSVATVSSYLLGLIAPAADVFRSVEIFVYVDHLCPASFENELLVPHARLDFHAPSDFGQVLVDYLAGPWLRLNRNTVFVVLGDARNNRRPPRAGLLADIQTRARAVFWLNPEPVGRWNSGDSVMAQYARYCTAVLECGDLASLLEALGRIL